MFANEALRPGEQISVGSLTILFTDLRGSTRIYREIGDAPAFGLVMSHFYILRDAIAEEGGAIVKNIGDAVMAVFREPTAALRAILRAQRALARPPAGAGQNLPARPLALKVGIHYGPCIAVTLNERLDYFGTTVNAASRLVELSNGTDVVMSSVVRRDPEIETMLAETGANRSRVVIMPEGTTREAVGRRAEWLVEACKREGFRYSPRLHIDLWGNRRGV